MSLNKRQYDKFVWGLKYRPEKIEDVILPERFKELFKRMLDEKNIGNILLNGQRGCGKTTVAFCLADQLGAETLYINMSKDNSIEVIRRQITEFASTVSAFDTSKKIVVGDEMDRLSPAAMDSLKAEIELFSKNCNFVFITNHKNRIIQPLISRLDEIDFVFSNDETKSMKIGFAKRIAQILSNEGVAFEKAAISKLINMHFPDMRKIINVLHMIAKQNMNSITIESLKGSAILSSDLTAFYKTLKDKDFNGMRKTIANLSVEYSSFYTSLFETIDTFISPESIPQAIILLAQYQYESAFCVNPQITLSACCTKLMVECDFK